jgi:hypothetical protein
MSEDEHKIINFTPRDGDVVVSARIETGRQTLKLIDGLAKTRGITARRARSMALELGAQELLEQQLNSRRSVSSRTVYEAPSEEPSA